jgi:hypothetical protein
MIMMSSREIGNGCSAVCELMSQQEDTTFVKLVTRIFFCITSAEQYGIFAVGATTKEASNSIMRC